MKDSRDPFSGETYLLPKELAKKYADAEALEIEYLSSKQSGLVHPDELAEIRAEAITAKEQYREALLEKMPEAVREAYQQQHIQNRIERKSKDFQAKENTKNQPLYADIQIQWKDNRMVEDKTVKLSTGRDENDIFYQVDGVEGLKKLASFDNGKDFIVKDVKEIYGQTYNIAVVDYLTRDVNIQVNSEEDAMKKLDREYYRGNIVLGSEDFNRRDVLQLETGLLRPEPVRLMATPEGTYTLTVQEILQHNEKIDAKDLPSAIEKVEDMLKNYEIIVGSEDDYVETNYIQHARLIDNSLETPVEIPLADIADFQRQLAEAYPHGMTVHLQNESVEHLKQFPAGMDLNGLVNAPEQELLSAHGSLHAEARLMPDDYAHVYPDTATYTHEKLASEYDSDMAAATLYLHQHPDMDGGRVNLNMNPQIMKRIYVEDMPLPNLLHAIEDRNIQTDKELIQFRDEVKNLDRISEVSLYKHNSGSMMLRCKIDGEQQSGRAVPVPYLRSWYEGDISKREMAAKMFSEELKQSANQEENRGIKR